MTKRMQILIITPFFIILATLTCVLFAKLDQDHRKKLAIDERNEEIYSLKELDDGVKDDVREIIKKISTTSNFALTWDKKFNMGIKELSSEKVAGFDLIAFILTDDLLAYDLTLVKEHKKQYTHLLQLVTNSLKDEYESTHYFNRARKFAQRIGVKEEIVLKVLKEGIEAMQFEKDLSSIDAMIDFFQEVKNLPDTASVSLL